MGRFTFERILMLTKSIYWEVSILQRVKVEEERVEMREKGGYRPKIHPTEASNQVLPSRSETEEHLRSKYGNFSLAPNRQLATRGGACYRQPVPNFLCQFLRIVKTWGPVLASLCNSFASSSTPSSCASHKGPKVSE